MALDRCIAIVTPLKAGKIRVSPIGTFPNVDFIDLSRYSTYVVVPGF